MTDKSKGVTKADITEKAGDIGKSAVKIAFWSTIIYPVSVVVIALAGSAVSYYFSAPHFGFWLTTLCGTAGFITGGVAGFFIAGAIVSSLVGDLVFDAGWETTKLGWKEAKHRVASARAEKDPLK